MRTRLFLVIIFLAGIKQVFAQGNDTLYRRDSIMIRKIHNEVLGHGYVYRNLEYLCESIGPRLSGSPKAKLAVEHVQQVMESLGLDTVYLQEVMVPHWERGPKESATIIGSVSAGRKEVNVCALGGSIATPPTGLTAEIVEVKSFEELKNIGKKGVQGKFVFFNKPMDSKKINTFEAYGEAGFQRNQGAEEADKYGAVGVIVRSLTTEINEFPHTGAGCKEGKSTKIPACAISTGDANNLSNMLKSEPKLKFYLKMGCQTLPDVLSHNVVGEKRGTEFPNEIIVVGGHLDSWDLGTGAQDDGAGVMQSIEAYRLLRDVNYKPKRTIRIVAFMNEENGGRGGKKYSETAKANKETHIAAIESDAGGLSPRGFNMSGMPEARTKLKSWANLFAPYNINNFDLQGGGADINYLKEQGAACIGLFPDSQRYFDYHHCALDVMENVNKRELELGAGAMSSLIYLISEYGMK